MFAVKPLFVVTPALPYSLFRLPLSAFMLKLTLSYYILLYIDM